tara:strand:+ start:671 stop:946 length:276 start_codon:yes stop_codon:yes gene_type:complete
MAQHLGLDGFPRKKEEDENISLHIQTIFKTPAGKETLKYLRSITIEMVSGGSMSDAELRHLEGQRFIVALIEKRIKNGEKITNGRTSTKSN